MSYLDFIQGIAHEGTLLSFMFNGIKMEGEIIKISRDHLAIKDSFGSIFVFSHNDRITNLSIVNKDSGTDQSDQPQPMKSTEETTDFPISTLENSHQNENRPRRLYYRIPDDANIDKEFIISLIDDTLNKISGQMLERSLSSNGQIIGYDKGVLISFKGKFTIAPFHTIIEKELKERVENKEFPIPVIINVYDGSNELIVLPNSLIGYLEILKSLVEQEFYFQSKLLAYFLKKESKIRESALYENCINKVLDRLNYVFLYKKSPSKVFDTFDDLSLFLKFKGIQYKLNDLEFENDFTNALELIDGALEDEHLVQKYKEKLYKRAIQLNTATSNYDKAIDYCQELLKIEESRKASSDSLCSLCYQIAILYGLNKNNKSAIEYGNRALNYKPDFYQAQNLLDQISRQERLLDEYKILDEYKVDTNEIAIVSRMIEADIREHKYINEDIIDNSNKPTPEIAERILQEAEQTKQYITYIEAAKAYGELSLKDVRYQDDFQKCKALYASKKGNYIYRQFFSFKYKDLNHATELIHLRDSACSYYMESLCLVSKLSPNLILKMFTVILWMNITMNDILNNCYKNRHEKRSKFRENLFKYGLQDENSDQFKIICKTIVEFGSASPWAWNEIIGHPSIKGGFVKVIEHNSEKRKAIFNAINRVENFNIDTDLKPAAFLKEAFIRRNIKKQNCIAYVNEIKQCEFDLHKLRSLTSLWDKLNNFNDLLSTTDMAHKQIGDQILNNILSHYLDRGARERMNLLVKAQNLLDVQINQINQNTTYYGRILFFPLFSKWRETIQNELNERIDQTLPFLEVIPDPQYIVNSNGVDCINFIIKNSGESTAEGYEMKLIISNHDKEILCRNRDIEIPADSKAEQVISIPSEIHISQFIECQVGIRAYYQGGLTAEQIYPYTIEREPLSLLKEEDIKWDTGSIPNDQMFKGRQQIISKLYDHYTSREKHKTYILYGLTRTGKTSILKFLKDKIKGASVSVEGIKLRVLPVILKLNELDDAETIDEMWELILTPIVEEFNNWAKRNSNNFIEIGNDNSAKNFIKTLRFLKSKMIYPLIMIDEFSFIKNLMDRDLIRPSFLHTMRDSALGGLCSYIFAGTFDIKELVRNPQYGITGQLVNTIEEQIGEIDSDSAEELINAMEDSLKFTPDAVNHIHKLSGDVPYFIQIICQNCAYYAIENKRMYIGYPELENVVKILTGEKEKNENSKIQQLSEGTFSNNMYSPTEPDVNMILTCISHLNRQNIENPRGISNKEIQQLWNEKSIPNSRHRVAEALRFLDEDKKILKHYDDDGVQCYKITVDIFRRWLLNRHPDIELEFDLLSKI